MKLLTLTLLAASCVGLCQHAYAEDTQSKEDAANQLRMAKEQLYWQKMKNESSVNTLGLDIAVMECVNTTENIRYQINPNTHPKTHQELFADG